MRNTCACAVLLASIGWCQRPETPEENLARMHQDLPAWRDIFVMRHYDPFDLNAPTSQRDRPSGEAFPRRSWGTKSQKRRRKRMSARANS